MFSGRLRVIFMVITVALLGVLARAMQVHWLQNEQWQEQIRKRSVQRGLIDTTRGRILDVKGRELAVDSPCLDAVIDYRVIKNPPDPVWVRDYARASLKRRLGRAPAELIEEQVQQVKQQIEQMWQTLGDTQLTGINREQVEDRRHEIVRRVQMQRRHLWLTRYVAAEKQKEEPAWWLKWLIEENQETDEAIDSFDVTVEEQRQSHAILPSISTDLANYLGKNKDRFPGLDIRPGIHRNYPYNESACHVLGYLAPVDANDIAADGFRDDRTRKYWPSDLVGRGGIESMCESALRGVRGSTRREVGREAVVESSPQPGQDITLTIDIELQKRIEAIFAHGKLPNGENGPFYGAAILLDVPTNEVRAMVSYPNYDLNQLSQTYVTMVRDEINRPLLNRATQAQLEPGSTVKPMVGLAGIAEKVVGPHETIDCTGYLVLRGVTYRDFHRCWIMRSHNSQHGPLEFAGALERSCNIWPENVADRLGLERIREWFGQFGLGRRSGIGLPEASGRLPKPGSGPARQRNSITWSAGTGQGILATPIQMADVAATIARDGLWRRPTLVQTGWTAPATQPDDQQRQLSINKSAFAEARKGMFNVVNGPAGTGKDAHLDGIAVAGKTGTAQASKFSVYERDSSGNKIIENGRAKRRILDFSTKTWTNPEAPWYRASGKNDDELCHAWFIGFAPAEKPTLAVVVMVEYGGSGGKIAGTIASHVLEAAQQEGYLASAGR